MNPPNFITFDQALNHLRGSWETKIKGQVASNPSASHFEARLSGTADEKTKHSFRAKRVPFSEAIRRLQNPDKTPPHLLFGAVTDLPKEGALWIFEWMNLTNGGFVAFVDGVNGKVYLIQILPEG